MTFEEYKNFCECLIDCDASDCHDCGLWREWKRGQLQEEAREYD